MSKGLFDDILYGSTYTSEGAELSYEEESYIENNITAEPESLSNYAIEGYIGMTQAIASIYVSEGIAATELLKGKDRNVVMESLSDRLGDAYDTLKRWATKIWKAIKKFANKAWARLKYIKERIMAFFTSYENQLQNADVNPKVKWCTMYLDEACKEINNDYNNILNTSHTNAQPGSVVESTVKRWRGKLYNNNETGKGEPVIEDKTWNEVKGQVLRITSMGYDKYYKDFLNWGEKDYREAMSIDKEMTSDRSDDFYDYDKDAHKEAGKADDTYYDEKRNKATEVTKARAKLHLRQRGIQLIQAATTRMYNQSIAAARVALRSKSGIKEAYMPDTSIYGIMSMI